MRLLSFACAVVLACTIFSPAQDQDSSAETPKPAGPPPTIEAQRAPVNVPAVPMLANGTPVFLKLLDTVKVKEAKVGDPVKFMATSNVRYRDLVVIPRETIVMGRVTEVRQARRMSRGSHLGIEVPNAKMLNGAELTLRGKGSVRGEVSPGLKAADDGMSIGPGSDVGFLAAPVLGTLFLAKKGTTRNAEAGAPAVAYVNGDTPLDLIGLRALPPNTNPPAAATGHLHVLHPAVGLTQNLYCNGVPIAKLGRGRRLSLDLPSGDYRFAFSEKKPLQLFVTAGEDYYLIFDFRLLTNFLTTLDAESGTRLEASLKPVKDEDFWNDASKCTPLPQELPDDK
jgi:hypothetical protein